MAARIVRREGWSVNRKRIQRLWRDEGLKRPPHRPCKRRRVRRDSSERLSALRPNHVWAIDFQFDETADRRRLKLANIVDEYTREALAMRVGRSCTADDLLVALDRLVAVHGAPSSLRCDNGPELIALGAARLVPTVTRRDQLHRTGIALGEPLRRELQRPRPRRAAQHRGLRVAARSAGRCRGMADLDARMLGNGLCTRPVELDCRMESACETCSYFQTGPEFVRVLLRQRDHARDHHQPDRAALFDGVLERVAREGP